MKKILCVVVALVFVFSNSMPAFATVGTDTWVGTTSSNLGDGTANWTGQNNPPQTGDALVFGAAANGGANTTLTDTLASLNINGITFNGPAAFTINGSGSNTFTLTGNLANDSSANQVLNMDIAGTIVNAGTSTGSITLGGTIASTVTSITEDSLGSSALKITSAMAIGGTTTFTDTAGTLTASDGLTGSGNVILDNNSGTGSGITFSTASINNSGTITNSGTSGSVLISGGVGSNVTAITENSTGSALNITTDAIAVNAGGTTLTNSNASGSSLLTVSGGVTGPGNLILDNNSSIADGITISGSAINLTSNTVTNSGSGSGSTLISAAIDSGVTSVIEDGTSSLILSNSGNAQGATTITAGTVQVTANGALGTDSSTVSVASGGALDLDGTTYSNTSALSLIGTGISSTGALTNSGGTASYGGVVTIGTGGASIGGSGNIILSGGLGANANALTKVGADTLILTSSNSNYSGTTTISAGTLLVGNGGATGSLGSGSVIDNANLGFDLSSASTVSNTISGTGTLTQEGTGALTLNGSNSYSGATTINSGSTVIAGSTSALGTGAGGVTNNGTLTVGTTSLNLSSTSSSYTQSATGSLDLTANSSSSYGSITTGHASTVSNSSTVNVTVGGYIYNGAVLDIVNTGGTGITGGSPTVTSTSQYVSFTSSVAGNNDVLTANHSSTGFASWGSNPNAAALGNVLDNETNPSSDLTNILNTLESSSGAQVRSALNTLGPIVDGGVLGTSTASLNSFTGASFERANNVLALASSGDSGVSAGDAGPLNGLWAKQYGGYLDQGTRDGIEGYNAWNTGTAVGVDHLFNDNLIVGASLGYAYGEVNSDVNSANANINSAEGTIYAGYQGTSIPYYIDLAGSIAENWYNGQRDITVDTINRIADSQYQGTQSGIYLEGGYKFDLGNNLQFTPLTSLQWTHLSINSYDETNAGGLDLNVNSQSYNTLESGLGASIAYPLKYNWGNFTPEFHAKWLYDYIDDDMSVTSAFAGGGASFTTNGATPARDGADIGGKLSFDLKNDVSLIAGLDTEIKDNFFGVYGSVSLRYKF